MKSIMQTTVKVLVILFTTFVPFNLQGQEKPVAAVLDFDNQLYSLRYVSIGSLVRLELDKTKEYEILDVYDVKDILHENGIDSMEIFGKTNLVKTGQLLGAEKMITGSVKSFGSKIIIVMKVIDVESASVEKSSVMEYINQTDDIQYMVQLSINDMLGRESNQNILDMLVNYERPLTSANTKVKLNGPRMGVSYTFGDIARRLEAPRAQGGFNMYPLTSMIGYQHELQYMSSGEFQALIEFIGAINGMESGTFYPSLTLINGFRFNKSGIEFGIGPTFRLTRKAYGYYDNQNNWRLEEDLPEGANFEIIEQLDHRGQVQLSTGLIVAAGKTFRSGYLNVPVNVYMSPRKEGTMVGMSFGFNVAKKVKN